MAWFRVFLHGKNFLLAINDSEGIRGFYTIRFVEAACADEAELLAVNLIRQDEWLKASVRNERNDPPMIYAEKIEIVASRKSDKQVQGYTFYSE